VQAAGHTAAATADGCVSSAKFSSTGHKNDAAVLTSVNISGALICLAGRCELGRCKELGHQILKSFIETLASERVLESGDD
jgi:hypothetical protein